MIVVVAPGQGSQTPGFLSPWLEQPASRELLQTLSTAADLDLIEHGTVSDADTIRDTAIAQPLIVAAGILTLSALLDGASTTPAGIAGHSVGEITAASGAGILTPTDAMTLVAARGRAMAEAAALVDTGMSAVIGGDIAITEARLAELGLFPANYNGGGQLVVAGAKDALATLAAEPPAGTRVIPLQVAGAFHTSYMQSAVEKVREVASTLAPADPTLTIWTNSDGTQVTSGRAYLDLLVGQVSSPVRWDSTMESFSAAGVTGIIELAPAGALVGLAKRGLKGVPTVGIKTPADLDAARAMLEGAAA
ncbi:ACP S-malonyltransferase [Naasia lichenicola]|uniref:[acyl-carrier-protein] S-malonyltransferase n=1 Tax=Naasia lichenicola TaxID=2565933 RepID=A0A4S4FRE4_9MICO|nr:ACP S-malonyltransferase [Naasia lichenicola]THG32881.1 ACP S-malonyltransferase [Naasia lichenicola]